MSTYDDETEPGFFEEPQTLEAPRRPARRMRRPGSGGPRGPSPPPPGAVALTRLAGLVALAIAIVVGLVFWVGSCQGQSRQHEYSTYMHSVETIAHSSTAAGAAFANELGSAKLTLAGLQAKLEQWSRQQQQEYDNALRLRPPGPLQAAHQEVLATLQLRAIGLAGLANAIAGAGSSSTSTVAQALAGQAQFLSASDIVWAELFRLPATETLKRLGVTGVVPPVSQFVANPEVISASSFGLVYARLKSTNSTGHVIGLHGTELLGTEAVSGGTTTPLSPSTTKTVNVAANLVFKVTLEDSGNFQEVRVPVTLTVIVSGKNVLSQTKSVPSIVAQGRQTVSFGNLNLPTSAFGASATVRINIGKVPGELDLTNNRAAYPVFFSLPSGG